MHSKNGLTCSDNVIVQVLPHQVIWLSGNGRGRWKLKTISFQNNFQESNFPSKLLNGNLKNELNFKFLAKKCFDFHFGGFEAALKRRWMKTKRSQLCESSFPSCHLRQQEHLTENISIEVKCLWTTYLQADLFKSLLNEAM